MNWERVKFSALYSIPSKNGLTKPSSVRGTGYKMINMGELFSNDRLYDIQMELVPLSDSEKLKNRVMPNDLLFARQSLVLAGAGKCSIVMETSELTVFESHLIRVRLNPEIANPLFYYYHFRWDKSTIKSIIRQCAQAGIRGSDLSELIVDYPPLNIQRRIADILSAYDDLIENNRRRIRLLEEAARQVYTEWFVRLRFPGHEHTRIIDGLPEGWERKTIGEVARITGGGTPKTQIAEYWDGDIPWMTPTDITRNDCLYIMDSSRKITEKGLKESSAKLVPPYTILMTSRASVGFFALTDTTVCTNQGFINIIPKTSSCTMYFLFNLMNRVEEIRHKAKGSTYPEINKTTFSLMDIVIPSQKLTESFNTIAQDIFLQIRCLKKQTVQLAQARDLLLPRLMRGELEVGKAG